MARLFRGIRDAWRGWKEASSDLKVMIDETEKTIRAIEELKMLHKKESSDEQKLAIVRQAVASLSEIKTVLDKEVEQKARLYEQQLNKIEVDASKTIDANVKDEMAKKIRESMKNQQQEKE